MDDVKMTTCFNYTEYVLSPSKSSKSSTVYNIEKKKYDELLARVSQHLKSSGSQKHYTRYVYEDMHYDASNVDSKTYRIIPIELNADTDSGIIKASYVKEKIPFYMFPSTNRIYENFDMNTIVFRIHKNLFINFETHLFIDGQLIHKIYVNHNLDERDDTITINKKINDSLSLLQSVPIS